MAKEFNWGSMVEFLIFKWQEEAFQTSKTLDSWDILIQQKVTSLVGRHCSIKHKTVENQENVHHELQLLEYYVQ